MRKNLFLIFLISISCSTSETCKNPGQDVLGDGDSNETNNSTQQEPCFEMGPQVTQENCYAKSDGENFTCTLNLGRIGYLRDVDGSLCMFADSPQRWFDSSLPEKSSIPICMETTGVDGTDPPVPRYCNYLSEFVIYFVEGFGIRPPEDWFLCNDFIPDCRNTCGNGVIESGEVCDGDQLGAPADCEVFSQIMNHGAYSSGKITCDEACRWDFSECR